MSWIEGWVTAMILLTNLSRRCTALRFLGSEVPKPYCNAAGQEAKDSDVYMLAMSTGSRLWAVIDCEEFETKY